MKKTTKQSPRKCSPKDELLAWDLSDLYNGIDDKQISIDLDSIKIRLPVLQKNIKENSKRLMLNNFMKWQKAARNDLFWEIK
jgi:hypothetical protein